MRILIQILPFLVFFFPFFASAHVGYVLTPEQITEYSGPDMLFLLKVFGHAGNILLVFVTTLIVIFLVIFIPKVIFVKNFLTYINLRLNSYHEFIPWIIRLSLGIALIGAGTTNVLISPAFPDQEVFSLLQILLGFMYLVGFLLVPATLATIILFIFAFIHMSYLAGNLDFLALALAFLVFHSGRPGIDDITGFSLFSHFKISHHLLAPILRAGIGISMIYLALHEKIFSPHLSELVVNQYNLTQVVHISPAMWVLGAGLVELLIGFFIMIGFYTRLIAVIAFLVLSLSFFFFKEAVFSHVTLFGILSLILIEGGGYLSADRWINGWKKLKTDT